VNCNKTMSSEEEQLDEQTKKEEERLNKTIAKVGSVRSRNRAVSWNVNVPAGLGKNASTASRGKIEQAEAVKSLQDHIRHEDSIRIQPPPHLQHPSAPAHPAVTREFTIGSPENKEDEEKHAKDEIGQYNDRRNRQEEDRLSKWTTGSGRPTNPSIKKFDHNKTTNDKPTPSVLLRLVDHQPHGVNPPHASHEPEAHEVEQEAVVIPKSEELLEAIARFAEHATAAAKALKYHKGGETLAKSCSTTISIAKSVATMTNDDDIFGWARALEGSTNMLRTRLDSGATGQEYLTEISNALGQLYLSVIAL